MGEVVGIILGIALYILLFILGLFLWRQRRRRKQPETKQDPKEELLTILGTVERYAHEKDPEIRKAMRDISELLGDTAGLRAMNEVDKQWLARYKTLDELREVTPREFEELIATMFRQMGHSVILTKASRDKGIDMFLDDRKAIVECKKYKGSVGQPVVRDFYGTMIHNRAECGYIVTTGTFSLPAQTWAKGKPIHLVDGMELVKTLETIKSERSDGTQPD